MSSVLRAGLGYFTKDPRTIVSAAREAARLRFTIPLDVVRVGLAKIRSKAVSDFSVAAEEPGLRLGLVASLMGNQLRVGAVLLIDEIMLGPSLLRVALRVNGLTVEPQGNVAGPISALLASGAIDLAKPGNLMGFLPKKPAMIAEATQNARAVAEKFAADSKSSIGKIKSASQGQFTIEDRDKTTPYIKRIRVVSTVEYYLAD